MADETNVVLTANTQPYERSVDQATQSTNRMLDAVGKLTVAIDTAFRSAGRSMQIGGGTLIASMTAAGFAAGRLEHQMAQLNASMTMVSKTQVEYQKRMTDYSKTVTDLRATFGQTSAEAIGLVTQLQKMGQASDNVNKLSESFTKLGAVTGEGVGGLVQNMIQLQRMMGTEGVKQTQVFNATLADLSQNAGASATSILQFSQQIAPVAKVAGLTTKEIMGVSTAFVKSGADGYAAGSAFNKMLTDITRSIQYGSPELSGYANLVGKSVEQFKAMPRVEAVTEIFEAINKQGPDAIKTLDRFGLDGIRTLKSIQAVAGTGGLRDAVSKAIGGTDQQKFDQASERAFEGLNDQMRKIAENGKMIAEAFGSGVLPVMTQVASAINAVLSPMRAMMQLLGGIPGGPAMLAGGALLAAGTITKMFTGLSTIGVAKGAITTMRGGFRSGRGLDLDSAEEASYQARRAGLPSEGNFIQHAGYGASRFFGGNYQRYLDANPDAPTPPARFRAAMRGAGIWGAQTLGGVLGAGLDPLSARAMENNFDRDQRYQMFKSANARDAFGWKAAGYQYNNLRGMMGSEEHAESAAAYRKTTAAMNTAADSTAKYSTATRAVIGETGKLAAAMGQAAGSTLRLGATGAGALGMRGLNAMAPMARGAWNFLGGGMGATMIGGMAAMSLYQAQQGGRDRLVEGMQATDSTSPFSIYAAAVGEAARATTDFTSVLKANAASLSSGYSNKPTADLVAQVNKTPGDYTNAAISGADFNTAKSIAGTVMSANPSNAVKTALQADLLRRFGTDAMGQSTVTAIMAGSTNASRLDLAPQFKQMYGEQKWHDIGTNEAAAAQSKSVGNQLQEMMSNSGASPQESAQILLGASNQAMGALNNVGWGPFRQQGGTEAMAASIVQAATGRAGTKEEIEQVNYSMIRYKDDPIGFQNDLASLDTPLGRAFKGAIANAGPNYNRTSRTLPNTRSYATSWSQSGMNSTVLDRLRGVTLDPNAKPGDANWRIDQQPGGLNATASTIFGRDPGSGGVGGAVANALANQGNQALQWTGMSRMGDAAMAIAGSFSAATRAVDEMKAAATDAQDPLYQLAMSARGYIRQRQSEAMGYMSQTGVASQLMGNYREDLYTDINNPTAESGNNREQSRQQLEGFIQSTYQKLKSFALSVREFNISRQRGEEDFNRQQEYALDDYNRQRQYAQDDFNRSRHRAEEDFQHSVVMMTRNTAKTMTNIYERMNVQRTWSAANLLQNMADQQTRLSDQQSQLARLRKQGLSGDAISQMGLNDPGNMQQLTRIADDILNDPGMIKQFNEAARKRMKSGKSIATDQDNEQWKEMNYNFKKNMARGESDFQRGLDRQAEQFNISFERMTEQYDRSINRAGEDLNRSMEEITGDFNDMAIVALDTLTGTSKAQMESLLTTLGYTRGQVFTMATGLVKDLNGLFIDLGISVGGSPQYANGGKGMGGRVMVNGVPTNPGQFAAGGEIGGSSRYKTQDNVLIKATAGEYMQPVDSVQYYGKDFMEDLRHRRIPRSNLQGLASGGMVYKQMEAWLDKNIPGTTITSDYRPGAITALGNVSMHSKGKAVDMAPSMETFNKILGAFGSKIYQLFYSPADGRTMLRGKPWKMDPVTKGDHWNHVHWAMESMAGLAGTQAGGGSGWDGSAGSLLSLVKAIAGVGQFNSLMTKNPVKPLRAYGNNWLANAVTTAAMGRVNNTSGSVDGDYTTMSLDGSSSVRSMVQQMAAGRGWTGSQWSDLAQLIQHESSWNPKAQNPSSTAYGLFQFLDSTWKSVGGTKTSDPTKQAEYGLKYIAGRYGNPTKAWNFWNSHTPHWYGDGAVLNGRQTIGVGEKGPEAVLPLNGRGVDFVWELMKRNTTDAQRANVANNGSTMQGSTVSYYSRIDKSTTISGPITVQAQDPDEMLRRINAKKSMEALKGRH